MAERIRIDHGNFETVVKQLPDWKVPASVKREVQRFLDDLGLGKVILETAPQPFHEHVVQAPAPTVHAEPGV